MLNDLRVPVLGELRMQRVDESPVAVADAVRDRAEIVNVEVHTTGHWPDVQVRPDAGPRNCV